MEKEFHNSSAQPREARSRAILRRVSISALMVLLIFALRWLLQPYMNNVQPFSFFYIAVAVIAWREGWKAAAVVAAAGLLLGWWFFLETRFSFRVERVEDWIQIMTYCCVSTALVLLVHRIQRAERAATILVQERTRELQTSNEKLRREIVQHEETESVLRASEERFRLLVDAIRDYAIFRLDSDGNIMTWNPGAERLYGYSASEIIGGHFSQFYTTEDIQDGKPARELAVAAEQGKYSEEGWRVRKDGTRFWANVTVAAVRDSSGAVIGMAKITRDVTERMEMEQQLRDTIAELEHFSYSITHDMRAPLRGMRGFAHILEQEAGARLEEQHRDYLRRIVVSAERMDALIRDALNYSRIVREKPELKPVEPTRLLRGILESYPEFRPPQVHVEVQEKIPAVLGNEAAMTQCFSNLLDNAVKFVPPNVTPHIKVRGESRDGFVRLWFEDNGIGIPPDQHERIFKMFQRGSQSLEGTGIGLAIVRKVVERLGGKVGVESEPNNGSRFWIDLKKAK